MVFGLWFEGVRVIFFLFYYSNALPVPMLRQVSQNSCFTCTGAHFRSNMAPDPEMLPESSCGRSQGEFWLTLGCSRYCFGVSCGSKMGPFFAWERYY